MTLSCASEARSGISNVTAADHMLGSVERYVTAPSDDSATPCRGPARNAVLCGRTSGSWSTTEACSNCAVTSTTSVARAASRRLSSGSCAPTRPRRQRALHYSQRHRRGHLTPLSRIKSRGRSCSRRSANAGRFSLQGLWRRSAVSRSALTRVTAKLHYGLGELTVRARPARSEERGPDTDFGMPPGFPILGASPRGPVRRTGLPGGATTPASSWSAASP